MGIFVFMKGIYRKYNIFIHFGDLGDADYLPWVSVYPTRKLGAEMCSYL